MPTIVVTYRPSPRVFSCAAPRNLTRQNAAPVGRRIALQASASLLALCIASPTLAECTAPTSGQANECTNTDDSTINFGGTYVNGTSFTLDNEATLSKSTDAGDVAYAIRLNLTGVSGSSTGNPDGNDGVDVTVTNNGALTLSGTSAKQGSQTYVGGIDVEAFGGLGTEPDDTGNGGSGGDGGVINITNNAAITIESGATLGLNAGIQGINARSVGVQGGRMNDDGVLGDQHGGAGGSGDSVHVTNNNSIQLGASGDTIQGDETGRAIKATSEGGTGGTENGAGGAGGNVTVDNHGDLSIYYQEIGSGSLGVQGIYARSLGGQGVKSNDDSDNGGDGAGSGTVTVTNTKNITVELTGEVEVESAGILALSDAGNGGGSSDKATGGVGGNSETLTVSHSGGVISTTGDTVRGIVARTSGGDGGNGNGDNRSTGGKGGTAGRIQVNLTASVETDGYEAYGVLGQSVGGTGGDNAGTAGRGGNAGTVGFYATNAGAITTTGDYSAALTLHSIGGGGGTGEDFTGVLAGSGGNGGNGGNGTYVTATTAATLTTSGDHSYGILAQSIGGSGGTGGISAGLTVELGGNGGGGGAGNQAAVNNTGVIQTSGDYAYGIVAQTISGGGGAAGTAGGALAVGGSAGSGSDNDATGYVTNAGNVTTTGAASAGIVVQSIGGGGGTGGGADGIFTIGGSGSTGGHGGSAELYHVGGTVQTSGDYAYGLVAQSIGGGGGSGGDVIDISAGVGVGVGGSGSGGGNGGTVCVTNNYTSGCPDQSDNGSAAAQQGSSSVVTSGRYAHGIVAQSVGGGGGNGGDFDGGSVASVVSVQIGGAGAGAGSGQEVDGRFQSIDVRTSGDSANGLLAQSIGGGGGNGGDSVALNGVTPIAVQVGGSAGGGGEGGKVTFEADSSTFTTTGSNARGVVAQSIGGGGGTGGSAVGADISFGFTMDTALGGTGGDGGSAGEVSASLSNTCISTGFSAVDCTSQTAAAAGTALGAESASSHGLFLQSVGGGGGIGGSATAAAMTIALPNFEGESFAASGTVALGGSGGGGGNGGKVDATFDSGSVVLTGGDGSHAIYGQSIGGGGGDGGSSSALSGTLSAPNTTSIDVAVSLGGVGGNGGAGGTVSLTALDTLTASTAGANANAILAQSIGGGGGDGGFGNAKNDKIGRGINFSLAVGLGGAGGSGGYGGAVNVSLSDASMITTSGSGSRAIVAQSIGGGGGTGQGGSINLKASGFTVKEAGELKKKEGKDPETLLKFNVAPEINLNFGGSTGNGNTAGAVTIDLAGAIQTTGNDADGTVVQSIGGGGGLGGSAGVDDSDETGGSNTGSSLARREVAIDSSVAINLSFGGTGGSGGHGGTIEMSHSASIQTTGDFADGVLVQSIGGGGGAGGAASTGDGDQTISANLALGGSGGSSGNGGTIDFELKSTDDQSRGSYTLTDGYAAHGIVVQSIGGGGGQGAVGTTAGAGSEEIGLGGGTLTPSLDMGVGLSVGAGLGGNGGASGNGGNVTLDTDGADVFHTITTDGDDAYAVFLQSIGGGGGTAALGAAQNGEGRMSIDLAVTVGGTGGSAGAGGNVSADFGSNIYTTGRGAFGILAQSIGGGGGTVGTSGSASGGEGSDESESHLTASFNGNDGTGGSGGDVSLTLAPNSTVWTNGDGAHGIIAQSVGDGGGIVGDLSGLSLETGYADQTSDGSQDSSQSGNGGNINVNFDGTLETDGDMAYGIIAQSVGGGGGLSGQDGTLFAGSNNTGSGSSGTVSVTQAGTLTTYGVNSVGIFAQSIGTASGSEIDVTVNGTVIGGTDDGAGVFVSEGKDNTLTVSTTGVINGGTSTSSGERADAVRYVGSYPAENGAQLSIDNQGTINGDVVLVVQGVTETEQANAQTVQALSVSKTTVAGTLTNQEGATWTLDEVAGAHVVNAGTIATSGKGGTRGYRFVGNFEQTSTGTLQVAADFTNGTSDLITFEGDATLAGRLHIASTSVLAGSSISVLSFSGAVTGSFDVQDSAAVDYALTTTSTGASVTVANTSFGSAFSTLNRNQNEVGAHLDRIFDSGDSALGEVMAGLNTLAEASDGGVSYAQALDTLTPGGALAAAATQTMLAQSRMDGAMVCRSRSLSQFDRSSNCTWADVTGIDFNQDGVGAYSGRQSSLNVGTRTHLDSAWTIGMAVGYENGSYTANAGTARAKGDAGYVAFAAGRSLGNLEIVAALTASYGTYDLTRDVALSTVTARANGKTNIASYGARVNGSHTFGTAAGYIRPALALDLVHTSASGYTETGAGSLNLNVEDTSQTVFIATPSVEVGRDVTLTNGMNLSLFAGASLSLSNSDEWTTRARFASANSSTGQFTSSVPIPDRLGRIGLGMSLARSDKFEARIEYGGGFGNDFESHGLSLGVTMRF